MKQASRDLLASFKTLLSGLDRFWEKEQTKADVEVFILDRLFEVLPTPPFTAEEKQEAARQGLSACLAAVGQWRVCGGGVMLSAGWGRRWAEPRWFCSCILGTQGHLQNPSNSHIANALS